MPDPDDTTDNETGAIGENLSVSQLDITDEKLADINEEHMETMVLDSLFMILASPEYLVQR